jgi:hypothetical protein
MDIFLFRDANFWADFPASAEMAMELYTYGKGIALDGVIAIDNQFLETLLSAIGPIYVSSLDQTVTENNILSELRSAWGPTVDQTNWVSQRKAFMGPLADSFRSKIETGLLSVDFLLLARDIQSAIRQGHFQIYIRDPMIAKFLNQAGWDGRQYTPLTQDFLQIIDTNMGFNKVNAVIDRKVRYQVLLSENGQGRAELQIKYIHHGQLSGQICVHSTTYSIDTQYADLFNYCYWNYVRVYAPKGSSLLQGSNHPLPAGQLLSGMAWHGQASVAPPEHVELTTFDNFLVLQPEHSVTATFTYLLPSKITVDEGGIHQYSLLVKKQAGLSQYDLEVILGIPEGTIVIQADPEPTSVNGQVLTVSTVATEDFLVTVDYEQDIHNGDDR